MKGEPARRHADAVEPDIETVGGQILIKLSDERFVVAPGVGKEESDHGMLAHGLSRTNMGHDTILPILGPKTTVSLPITVNRTYRRGGASVTSTDALSASPVFHRFCPAQHGLSSSSQ